MKMLAFLLILCFSSSAFAQQSAGDTTRSSRDSTLLRRPLPPSMAEELRRGQKARTIVFQDTLRSEDLTKLHFNDSSERQFTDSAISLFDTAVSLSHQEWLDSELFEIPELARFGSHVHYNYPPSIMTETYQQPVPFDSTLLSYMDPVTREHLPFFDQSPIPMPLEWPKANEAFIEAGAGNVDLPQLRGWFSQSLSDRTTLQGFAEYRSLDESVSAIHNYANILASIDAQLGVDPAIQTFHSQELKVSAGYNQKSVSIGNITDIDKTITQFSGSASFLGDATEKLHYEANISDHEFSDNTFDGLESDLDAMLSGLVRIENFRIIGDGNYSLAAWNLDTNSNPSFYGTPASTVMPISTESAKVLFGEQESNVEWYAGAEYLGGDGAGETSYLSFMPVARLRIALDDQWSLGGNFEPQVQLESLRALNEVNPFYSPDQILTEKQIGTSLQPAIDARSVVMDKFNLAAFLNYSISNDDELRFEARYLERARDVVLDTASVKNSQIIMTAKSEDTRTLSLSASGSFTLNSRDVLTASVEYASATFSAGGGTVQFVPNLKLDATYRLKSIWDNIRPSITFRSLSRPGKTLNFIDASININFTRAFEGILVAENILGVASDFWPGYPEFPRSVAASLKYFF